MNCHSKHEKTQRLRSDVWFHSIPQTGLHKGSDANMPDKSTEDQQVRRMEFIPFQRLEIRVRAIGAD